MKNRRAILLTALTLLLLNSLTLAQTEQRYAELPNFHQVNNGLYRGGQPKSGGFKKLSALGIKTVINLRDDDERARAEKLEAEAAGMRYFNIPMARLGRPSDAEVEQALAAINSSDNQPVFVHCKRGADRTGTIIAIYRITHDDWTSEKAKDEAKQYGLGFWETGMKDYISDYYKKHKQ